MLEYLPRYFKGFCICTEDENITKIIFLKIFHLYLLAFNKQNISGILCDKITTNNIKPEGSLRQN